MNQQLAVNGVSVTGELFTLYWQSTPLPPQNPDPQQGWMGPIVSPYYAPAMWPANTTIDMRVLRGTATGEALPWAQQPWCMGQQITVLGVEAQMIGRTKDTRLGMIIGQACGAGPDVFFHMAGVGAVSKTIWLPAPGIIMPADPVTQPDPNQPPQATLNRHFDVYTACDDVYTILLSIFYTSP